MTTLPFPHPRSNLRAAFTLVEIMIVVSIIALLAAVALPSLSRARDMSRRTALLKQMQMNMNAFELYATENNKLPMEDPSVSATSELPSVVPAGMATYMPRNSSWTSNRDGVWRWYYWPNFVTGYKGFYWLFNPYMTNADMIFIDQKLDDGNLSTGAIQFFNNGGNGLVYGVN